MSLSSMSIVTRETTDSPRHELLWIMAWVHRSQPTGRTHLASLAYVQYLLYLHLTFIPNGAPKWCTSCSLSPFYCNDNNPGWYLRLRETGARSSRKHQWHSRNHNLDFPFSSLTLTTVPLELVFLQLHKKKTVQGNSALIYYEIALTQEVFKRNVKILPDQGLLQLWRIK